MTRQDYELVARILKAQRPYLGPEVESDWSPEQWHASDTAQRQWRAIVSDFEMALAHENPRFDRVKFLKACGATP